jgi:hypothetical protein
LITFLDSQQIERSAQVGFSTVQSVNGELSVKGTIYTNDDILKNVDRGWRFRLNDEYYRIIYVKPIDTGKQIEVEFDAVHQFFYDMAKSSMYEVLNGTHSLRYYLDAIFKNSGYKFDLDIDVKSIRKSDFGCKSRLSLFNDIIKTAGVEFLVSGHLVRIRKSIGSDQSTLVRKNFNMNEITIEKDINSFVTYQKGFGAWKDETDQTKGRYESEYESPLAKIYGRIEAEPVVDERYKETGKLLERLKQNVDNSYKISIAIDMEDLSAAGYKTSTPKVGDYIMAINETLGIRKRVRIVSLESNYDVSGKLIKRKVVCNDVGSVQRYSSEMSVLSRSVSDSKNESSKAIETAIRALVSAEGKNTNYFGDKKPLDNPPGTIKKGDRLFLTAGDETELYFWSGSEWVIEPTRFDKKKFNVEFDKKAEAINKSIQQVGSEAATALATAGANTSLIKETQKISEQAKKQLDLQFADYKQSVDGRFTSLSSQLDSKANLIDFQRVQETSKLYERIIGSTENDISNKVARMAMTSQLFQVEVAKNVGDSRNYVKNADFRGGSKNWRETNVSGLNFNYEHSSQNRNKSGVHIYGTSINARYFGLQQTVKIELKKSDKITLSFLVSKDGLSTFSGLDIGLHYRKDGAIKSQAWREIPNSEITASAYKKLNFNYELPVDIDEINLMFYGNPGKSINLYISEIKLETGSNATPFTLAPEDTDEAVRTVQNQLAGSWAVQNLNSAGDLISGINLGANGTNRISGKLTHITGETLIENAVIKSAMIESVLADKITTGTLNASLVNIVNLNANNVTSGTFRGLTFEGGIIRGNNGNTEIDLNNNITTYRGQAGIKFESKSNYMVFSSGGYHAFLSPTQSSKTNQAAWAIGVAGKSNLDPNENFVGLKIFNGPYSDSKKLYLVGDVQIVKDSVSRNATATSFEDLVNQIQYNFIQIKNWFKKNNLGHPGLYDIKL